MKIGILVAMTSEYDRIASLLEGLTDCTFGHFTYKKGLLNGNEIILRQCGIGKVNAAVGTAELIRTFSPDCMISTGVAGGIDPCLGVMDVVVSNRVVYHDVWCGMGCEKGQMQGMPVFFDACKTLVECAVNVADGMQRIHAGLICTGDQFITSRSELDCIKSVFPEGLAVDMESAAIAHTCHIYGVPFVSFRIISDTPGADGHQQQYDNFWTEMADRSFDVTRKFLAAIPDTI